MEAKRAISRRIHFILDILDGMASLPLISHTTHLPLSAFTAAGPDAARFLQGQLTQDTERLRPMQPGSVASHQLTGACTPKGRLLASLQQWAPSDQVLGHLCPTALAPALVKRLRMYVLRAKVQVELTPWVVYGAWMTQCEVPVGDGMQLSEALWCLRTADAPSAVPRAWLVGDEAQLTSFLKGQPTPPGPRQAADWWAADIQAGWPTVWPETAEAFVPQMLNFDLLDGIGFKKGCYTGQEVVARSQYLGKLNRRMFWLQAAEAAGSVGGDVFESGVPDQVGQVVSQAGRDLLVSLGLESIQAAMAGQCSLHLASPNGPTLTLQTLPYAVPTEPQQVNRPRL